MENRSIDRVLDYLDSMISTCRKRLKLTSQGEDYSNLSANEDRLILCRRIVASEALKQNPMEYGSDAENILSSLFENLERDLSISAKNVTEIVDRIDTYIKAPFKQDRTLFSQQLALGNIKFFPDEDFLNSFSLSDKAESSWAIWRNGPFEARVLIKYKHPTAQGISCIQGIHGESYVDDNMLHRLDE